MRINKFIAQASPLSRRAADAAIEQGRVAVNGMAAAAGSQVSESDTVTLDGKKLEIINETVTIAFYKPVGYVCSRDGQGSPTIYDVLPEKYHHLNPVGRLDKDSSGLLLLTNNGQLAQELTHPKYHKTKIYEVTLDRPLQPLHQQMISDFGITLEDGRSQFLISRIVETEPQRSSGASVSSHAQYGRERTASREVEANNKRSDIGTSRRASSSSMDGTELSSELYQITMHEGRNRQIRRTFAALGYTVTTLHRTQFGNFSLGGLLPGKSIKL